VLVAINIDQNKEIPQKYGVQYPPAEIFVDADGNVITSVMGYTPKENFLRYINTVLAQYS
jgi:thioredoxin-related protein